MNLKNLFFVTAIVALVFGALFILLPAQTLALYGVDMTALIIAGIVVWYAREMGAEAQDGIMLAIIAGHGLGFIILLLAQLDGVFNNLGWATVALYLVLALGFAYFKFLKPSS